MQAVPSTYHQCLKFPYNGQEITISADSNPFQYCSNIKPVQDVIVPHSREALASSSSSHESKESPLNSFSNFFEKKIQLKDKVIRKYFFEHSLCLSKLPIFPKSYGQPTTSKEQSSQPIKIFDGAFIKVGTLVDENDDKDILQWIYKDEQESKEEALNIMLLTYHHAKDGV